MKKINRRVFIRSGLSATGLAVAGSFTLPGILKGGIPFRAPDIVSVSSEDPMGVMAGLLEPLGGIGRLVKAGDSVGILVNSPWKHPGTFTDPDVALAFVKLCKEAGAGNIICFKPVPDGYWEQGSYYDEMKEVVAGFRYGDERVEIEIAEGVELKQASMFRDIMEVDVFVNIPVAKHHAGTNFSGILKNLMGVSSSETNRHMHSPDGEYTYSKADYLSQCIADLNLIRQPDLCLMDAAECVLNNGPRGPGDTVKPGKILASIDPVAIDTYSADLIGFDPYDIPMLEKATALGLGKSDLASISVMEI